MNDDFKLYQNPIFFLRFIYIIMIVTAILAAVNSVLIHI